jgi:uncharacterized membrane protein YbhN (UPF0104 family)
MRWVKIAFLLGGLALLAFIVSETDLGEVGRLVTAVGWGMAAILAVYFVAFLIDTFSWQIALPTAPLDARWLGRLWLVRMIGEAFNNTIPAGTFGGEPVKAVLLKERYAIGYPEAAASLVLTRTVNLIALVAFLAVGFALILVDPRLDAALKAVAATGLAAFSACIFGFFLVQRFRLASIVATWTARLPFARRIVGALEHVHDIDARFVGFYSGAPARFASATLLALANWALGAVELWLALDFLGHPVTIGEAWVIESAAQLVRAGTFFIPASIGAQEGAFVVMCAAITGSPTVGVATALVRRIREVLWIGWGLALFSALRRARPAEP